MVSPSSWWERSNKLFTVSVAVLVSIAALDKALLGALFPMLEKTLGLHVDTIGYFSLFGAYYVFNLTSLLCISHLFMP